MRDQLRRVLATNWLPVLVIIALIVLPHFVGWITGQSPFGVRGRPVGRSIYWQGLMIEVYILAILAMSYNLLFGFAGVISFGHALFFGMGGYILAILLEKTDLSVELALIGGVLLALSFAAVMGLFMGLVTLRLRGVYFAIFTLAVAEMFFIYFSRLGFTGQEDGFTLSEATVRALPAWLNATASRLTFYYITLGLAVFSFLFIRRLIYSPTGAVFLAIRENEDRARTIGYNTLRYKLFAIMLSGMLASAAGMLHMIYNKKVGPEMLGVGYTIDPLLMTIIGGLGSFTGPVVGAAGLHLSDSLLRSSVLEVGSLTLEIGESWTLILGIIFIAVVLVFPLGVVGTLLRWWAQFQHNRRDRRSTV